ncbi:hypothetical protein GCM10007901_19320 [Dyella acidisoli]|uniref:Uncharacterized protein n=1 Tax=Dyella acidisoli TaxID=1867834 RepID=A0ABQ5XMP8_9GAMM|nr:hypothetical protein GCM10007901_19320 [Dyella acidisoli]
MNLRGALYNLEAVIPAEAGIQFALMQKAKMDSRFRGNDGFKGYKFLPQAVTPHPSPLPRD